jgi:alpha-beta hydrolase superfamily lysophospholipase
MDVRSRLVPVRVPRRPEGVVLVLHGGGARAGGMRVSPTQLSVLRMVPIARRVARAGHGRLAVFRLLNSTRGWDTQHTPVDDVRWALDAIRERVAADLPVGLVGHSLGGRAALLSADQPGVRSVVALAPFVYVEDAAVDARGTDILIVHGTEDRIAGPQRAEEVARRLQARTHVEFVAVRGGKHAMLRRHGAFSGRAAGFMTETLLALSDRFVDDTPGGAFTEV